MQNKTQIVSVVGPTASGKTRLSVELAKRFDGEIISADSMQIYRGMTVATAKPTEEEKQGVKHHLMDFLPPDATYSVAAFTEDARRCIADITERGKLPFLVGGTGLYVDAVADGYELSDISPDHDLRAHLETFDTPALYKMLKEKLPDTEIDPRNRHRVMRALERLEADDYRPGKKSPRYELLKLGVTWPREILKQRIDERLERRLREGMVGEVRAMLDDGVSEEFLVKLGLEYKYLTWYLTGKIGYEQMVEELGNAIKKFAKRQMTWFRRDPRIIWLDMRKDPAAEAAGYIERFLAE